MTENIPWTTFYTGFGEVPLYLLQFDKSGQCTSPVSLEAAITAAKGATDVVIVSHGWNNDFAAATARYSRLVAQLIDVQRARTEWWDAAGGDARIVLIGVIWPSTSLVAPWERGPQIAGADGLDTELDALAPDLDAERLARLRELLAGGELNDAQFDEAADILAAALASSGSDAADPDVASDDTAAPTGGELRAAWAEAERRLAEPAAPAGGFIADDGDAQAGAEVAGFDPLGALKKLRNGLRATTVLVMKDRAGTVGARGLAPVLARLADETPGSVRLRLVGHSYGCRVVLSALSATARGPRRPVDSVLLLQPALSAYAFAPDLGDGRVGGYRVALSRTRQPIVVTRSRHDAPLTKVFHLVVRRDTDFGDISIASGEPPSKFAALGGYGPQGLPEDEVLDVDMPAVGAAYPAEGSHRIVAVEGSAFIPDHGTVEVPESAWALLTQLRGGRRSRS